MGEGIRADAPVAALVENGVVEENDQLRNHRTTPEETVDEELEKRRVEALR